MTQKKEAPTKNHRNLSSRDWDETEAAIRLIQKVTRHMCDHKPKKEDPALKVWEEEMNEFRKFCVSVHYRRIAILQRVQRENLQTRIA